MSVKFVAKVKSEDIKDIKLDEENKLICPHCKQLIKKKELKIGKDKKNIIHGKCEGKVYFTDDLDLQVSKDLFENTSQFVKGKMTKILAKAVRDLDLSDVGSIGQTPDKTSDYKEGTPLKDAKKGKNKKIFTPPKQNQ